MQQSHGRVCWYSPISIVHTSMTLTRSKVKVNVTELLNFRKLPKIALFTYYLHFAVEVKTDGWLW